MDNKIISLETRPLLFEGQHEVMILLKEDVKFDFNGDFLVLAKSVSAVLEYARTEEVTKFCKEGQVFLVKNSDISASALNRTRKLNNFGESFITNLALNRVLGKSEKPKAEPFQDWLYEDVLPSVQKHGGYLTPEKIEEVLLNPDTIIRLATDLKKEREARIRLAERVKRDKPKVIFAEALETSTSSILIGELAKLLKQNDISIGQNRLFEKLRQEGYLIKAKGERWNDPTQMAMEMGLFEIKKRVINSPDGSTKTTKTTKVTGKGQIYFVNKFKSLNDQKTKEGKLRVI